jgi:hypothetical protein
MIQANATGQRETFDRSSPSYSPAAQYDGMIAVTPVPRYASADNENSLAILGQAEVCCIQEPPFNSVVQFGKRRKDCCKMGAPFHRQEPLDVLQYKERRLVLSHDIDHNAKQRSARIVDSLLLSGAAEWLAREAGRQQVVRRNLAEHLGNIAFVN